MNTKGKGTKAERELIHLFWSNSWACMRAAGSGSTQFPSPDILAGRKVAIECKITKEDKKYFQKDEIIQLKNFSDYFGAEPWIAIRFYRTGWFFINIEDLDETDKHYSITKDKAEIKGLSFSEFLGEGFN